MSDSVLKTIELVEGQIRELEEQLSHKQRMVNDLCKLAGRPPQYQDLERRVGVTSIRCDEFYGQPLATVVRMILEKRAVANLGAASVSEIYDAMLEGGYDFKAKNDENAKRGLYISLGKNSSTFHKLPNGNYGLLEWYPNAKEQKSKEPNGNGNGKSSKDDEKPLHEELQEDEASETEKPVKAK